jgi:hypothetical protein
MLGAETVFILASLTKLNFYVFDALQQLKIRCFCVVLAEGSLEHILWIEMSKLLFLFQRKLRLNAVFLHALFLNLHQTLQG